MRVIAQRDPDTFLLDVGDKQGRVLNVRDGEPTLSQPLWVEAILARGYWGPFKGDEPSLLETARLAGAKAAVQVRPYVREGHPVVGYTRHTSKLIGSAAEGGKLLGNGWADEQLAAIDRHADQILNLKPGEGLDFNSWLIKKSDEVNSVFGTHTYVVHGFDQHSYNSKPDEVIGMMRDAVEAQRESSIKAWTNRLRGGLVNKRSAPKVWAVLTDAVSENEALPDWQSFMDRTRLPDVILPWNEKGSVGQGMDVLVSAKRDTTTHLTHMNAYTVGVGIDLSENPHSVFNPSAAHYKPPEFHPGMAGAGSRDTAAVLRHEYAHSVWVAIDEKDRQRFLDLLPKQPDGYDEQRIHDELTGYAAIGDYTDDKSPIYREQPHGYRTETFSEAVAVVTSPRFKRDEWEPWIGRVADLIDTLEVVPQ